MAAQGGGGSGQHSLLTADRLKKELEAQKARARARAYLQAQGCDTATSVDALRDRGYHTSANINQELSNVEGSAVAGRDNTLDVIQRRKTLEAAKAKEQELKAKLLRQQADFQKERSDKDDAGGGGATKGEEKGPLPAGWQEVADPSGTGDVYYWNKSTGETTWTRPTAPSSSSTTAGGAASSSSSSSSSSTVVATATGPTLPPGWKEVKHAATGQVYYYHEETKTQRWTPPTSENDVTSDIAQRQKEHADSLKAAKAGGGGGAGGGKKRARAEQIDPLDPTGGTGGKWTDGMLNLAERMADSTAGGSLWQQRPLPAPGQILKGGRRK